MRRSTLTIALAAVGVLAVVIVIVILAVALAAPRTTGVVEPVFEYTTIPPPTDQDADPAFIKPHAR